MPSTHSGIAQSASSAKAGSQPAQPMIHAVSTASHKPYSSGWAARCSSKHRLTSSIWRSDTCRVAGVCEGVDIENLLTVKVT